MSESLAAEFAAFCAAHPTRRAIVGGHRWEYIDAGAGGPPLILLPGGFGVPATSFRYIPALAEGRRVVAVGYPPELDIMDGLCDGLAALMDALGLGPAWLLGGSASGFVAQAFVRRHPGRVFGMILAQSGAPRPARAHLSRACAGLLNALPMALTFGLLRLSIAADLRGGTEARQFWRGHFAEVLAQQSRAALVGRFRLAADFDANDQLVAHHRHGAGRVVIIESAGDGLIGPGERAALRARYPAAKVYTLAGGHNDSVERPEAQIALIRAILRPLR
ncbi:alpha/beta hydrolase [Oscillochloris sp. ZM17-4]|uniref:alpha/beta fold hydrolase n=1 Tax=Oscillochloris sp. ZM17-4 TaxID=2866714 RepID=UPI001C734AD8|nr:alpha/beta hydrolase [Oscillochloris sp. ZM17-4]MBX0331146.1 alpha/beta hydrolase [Oscillochloris sp. ZM17-4]